MRSSWGGWGSCVLALLPLPTQGEGVRQVPACTAVARHQNVLTCVREALKGHRSHQCNHCRRGSQPCSRQAQRQHAAAVQQRGQGGNEQCAVNMQASLLPCFSSGCWGIHLPAKPQLRLLAPRFTQPAPHLHLSAVPSVAVICMARRTRTALQLCVTCRRSARPPATTDTTAVACIKVVHIVVLWSSSNGASRELHVCRCGHAGHYTKHAGVSAAVQGDGAPARAAS